MASTELSPRDGPISIIDMGSNGIRFSIVASLARHLPIIYEERAPISLFEAQQTGDHSIASSIIEDVLVSLLRFKRIGEQAGVKTVRLIATEATRTASNSMEFQKRIMDTTGWKVELLSKEQEAEVSAMGVVASFYSVEGIVMDLGGGSVELNYVIRVPGEHPLTSSPNASSLPYGAAALTHKLRALTTSQERDALFSQIVADLRIAFEGIGVPERLKEKAQKESGYTLYMSGGGFRALGYMCMADQSSSENKSNDSTAAGEKKKKKNRGSYPLPIINGYSIHASELRTLAARFSHAEPETLAERLRVFRISKRRAGMIPASCFLVAALMEVIPIEQIYFSEGGVRQGVCYGMMEDAERDKDPLLTCVKGYPGTSSMKEEEEKRMYELVLAAIPPPLRKLIPGFERLLLVALQLANITSRYPKESRAYNAFHMPLAGGLVSDAPGLTHPDRAALALLLAHRHGGDIPDPVFNPIKKLVEGKRARKLCEYAGRVMELLFAASPLAYEPSIEFLTLGGKTMDNKDDRASVPQVGLVVNPKDPMVKAPLVRGMIERLVSRQRAKMNEEEEEPCTEELMDLVQVTLLSR
ncbi:uncharacterized protein VTP21DRAFT_5266 [Calcarisporiella thermophila]|uniref:uncharacterized protein n=1 Tax=Calcarisporiella thermophila TaxID=911321 RepID=UPI0037433F2C